jgi:hypothetical protein
MSAEWFVIKSGEHEGKVHMKGWMLSAMKVIDDEIRDLADAYAVPTSSKGEAGDGDA